MRLYPLHAEMLLKALEVAQQNETDPDVMPEWDRLIDQIEDDYELRNIYRSA